MPRLAPRRRAPVVRAVVAAAVSAGLALLSLPVAAHAAPHPSKATKPPTATFGVGPANAKGIDGRPNLNYSVQPGSSQTDHIAIINLQTHPVTLNVYPVDAANDSNGSITYRPKSSPGTDASRWITIDTPGHRPTIRMPKRASATSKIVTKVVPIDIHVPTNASPGDHLAAIIVSLTSKVKNKNGEKVNFEQRIALRAFFRVSGAIVARLSVEHLKATYHNNFNPVGAGSVTVSYIVKNTGNVNLGGNQAVKVTGLFGSAGSLRALAAIPVLLPGGRYSASVLVRHVWPEIYMHARVTVTPLGVVGAANPPLTRVSAQTGFFAIPWTLLGIIVLLALLIAGFVLWRRKHAAYVSRHNKVDSRTPELSGKT